MERFYGKDGAIRLIASNQEFCEEIAKRLEIDGGGENAGDFVRFCFQEWAKENYKNYQSMRLKNFYKKIDGEE